MIARIEQVVEKNAKLFPDPPRKASGPTPVPEQKWTDDCYRASTCAEEFGKGWTVKMPKETKDLGWTCIKDATLCEKIVQAGDAAAQVPKGKRFLDSERHLIASAVFDSLVFAGGLSVPSIISAALGALYRHKSKGSNEEITLVEGAHDSKKTKENIEKFVSEATRQYPGVVGFPFVPTKKAKGKDILGKPVKDYIPNIDESSIYSAKTNKPNLKDHVHYRTAYILAGALRDHKVWGEDEQVFKLRDLETYRKHLDVAWAGPATVPATTEHPPHLNTGLDPMSHGCPGKKLSFQMMITFFQAWVDPANGLSKWHQRKPLEEESQRVAICEPKPEPPSFMQKLKFWEPKTQPNQCPADAKLSDIKYWAKGDKTFANTEMSPVDVTPFFNDFILTQESTVSAKKRQELAKKASTLIQPGQFGCNKDTDCADPSEARKGQCFGDKDGQVCIHVQP